ncbi:hypothetical protein [Acinetobacter nosocomialis]|uniref:hypothetical protein n=1 Tax=Acinetobacter nosocomialis TaxID=106654 RepID=UPI0033B6E266
MLLKSVPGILPALKNSELATTKLWSMHIDRISNYQLNAVIAKFKLQNECSKIDKEVEYAVDQIKDAIYNSLIPVVKIARFKPKQENYITVSALINGLIKLRDSQRKALLFGLETGLSIDEVTILATNKAQEVARNSKLAKEIIKNCAVSIKTNLLFWESNEEKEHIKLENLEQAIYEAFGFTYNLLALKYQNIIYDEWFEYLGQTS